jgi:hypothetical protein
MLSRLIAFSICFDPGDGVAGIFGVIGGALDDPLQAFCGEVESSIGRFVRP